MHDSQRQFSVGASPKKLALAGLLAVVFVVVLIVQFGGISSGNQAAEPPPAGQSGAQTPRRDGGGGQKVPSDRAVPDVGDSGPRWPALEPAEVLDYDPFAMPEASTGRRAPAGSAQAEAAKQLEEIRRRQAEQDRSLERLRQKRVKAIIRSDQNGGVAVIGDQTVYVGDLIDGYRVIAIEPDGVVLERPGGG